MLYGSWLIHLGIHQGAWLKDHSFRRLGREDDILIVSYLNSYVIIIAICCPNRKKTMSRLSN